MKDLKNLQVKYTREDGTDCFSGKIIFHRPGGIIEALDWNPKPRCGGGLHFGAAEVSIRSISVTPGKVFEVEPIGPVVEIEAGKWKAPKLRIVRELNLSKVLSELAKNKDWRVKYRVAENPNTSKKTLSKLAKDEYEYVREIVAENPNTSKKTLSKLAKDEDWNVRYSVARNPNTSKRVLSKLAKDEDSFVQRAALINLGSVQRAALINLGSK